MYSTHKNQYLLKNTQKFSPYKASQKKLKIIRHIKTNSAGIRQKNKSSSRNSMYSTENNSEVAIKLVLAKVDISKMRTSLSIPYINKISDRAHTLQENKNKIGSMKTEVFGKKNTEAGVFEKFQQVKDGEDEEEFVLSPAKTHKQQNHAEYRYKTFAASGEKVVILSSSKVNHGLEFSSKKSLYRNTLEKIPNQLLTTAYFSQKSKPVIIPKFKKSPTIKILQDDEPEDPILVDIAKQVNEVNLDKFIKSDKKLLSFFPKIDLELLVYKIKKQQKVRREKNIKKWKHFDYRNLSSLK